MPEEKEENNESNNDIQQEISSEDSNNPEVSPEIAIGTEEIKRLEEKEHYELEYFSKDKVLEENKQLGEDLKNFKEKAAKLQKDNADSKKKFMHLQAEFENAQKRWNKNRQNLRIEYTASVLKKFLPLYDSFKKAIDNAEEAEKKGLENFYNQFMNVYKSYGAEPIQVGINDQFDYSKHEALSSLEKEDVPENSIVEVIQDGFKYGKEVIRYTKVIVSRKPKPPEPEPEPEEKEGKGAVSEEPTTEEEITEHLETEEKKVKEKKPKKHIKEKDKKKDKVK